MLQRLKKDYTISANFRTKYCTFHINKNIVLLFQVSDVFFKNATEKPERVPTK